MSTILVVEGDGRILESIRQASPDSPHEYLTAVSGAEALKLIKEQAIHLVVSDMRLQDMDGCAFLSQVKSARHRTMRIVLSERTDEAAVMEAIQHSYAMAHLLKPADGAEINALIDKLLATQTLLADNPLQPAVVSLTQMPTLPDVHRKLIRALEQDISLKDAAVELERDPTISAKILHLANSAFYGLHTGSIAQAVKYLGLNTIHSLVLTTAYMDLFAIEKTHDALRRIWNHAALTNTILHNLHARLGLGRVPDSAAAAGLLHNIGIPCLLWTRGHLTGTTVPGEYLSSMNILRTEESIFNTTHTIVGGFLLHLWDLPFDIVESAMYHHDPTDPRIVNRQLAASVHIAQHAASRLTGLPPLSDFMYTESLKLLKLDPDEADRFLDDPVAAS